MDGVKWIKITTDMFANKKIRYLRRLPDGDSIVLIWVMLLTMAGCCNAGGMIFLTENIPYDSGMLAEELGFPESTVTLAINAFRSLGMITDDEFLTIKNWEEYQNSEGLDKIREQTRNRVSKFRENKKLLQGKCEPSNKTDCNAENPVTVTDCNATCNATVTHCNALEEEREREKELERDIKALSDFPAEKSPEPHPADIVKLFNSICASYPQVKQLTENRKKAIKARLKTYNPEDFETVFRNAESSAFLKGRNKRNWSATFDWMMQDANFAKILEGNYSDAKAEQVQTMRRMDSDELEAIRKMMGTG